jgi:hypothetical protein
MGSLQVQTSYTSSPLSIHVSLQGSGNLKLAVQLPEGEDLNEWLAVHSMFPYLYYPDSIPETW